VAAPLWAVNHGAQTWRMAQIAIPKETRPSWIPVDDSRRGFTDSESMVASDSDEGEVTLVINGGWGTFAPRCAIRAAR